MTDEHASMFLDSSNHKLGLKFLADGFDIVENLNILNRSTKDDQIYGSNEAIEISPNEHNICAEFNSNWHDTYVDLRTNEVKRWPESFYHTFNDVCLGEIPEPGKEGGKNLIFAIMHYFLTFNVFVNRKSCGQVKGRSEWEKAMQI